MAQTLVKIASDFSTVLQSKVAIGDTTATLSSVLDLDGNSLANGSYAFTIDRNNSSKEYIICTITGTAVTSVYSISRQGVATSGFARVHRKGAEVIISDYAVIKRILSLLDGTTGFDASTPLKYDGDPVITLDTQIATKKYVDDVAIAGAAKATDSVYGISKLSTPAVSSTVPIVVGDNDTRVPSQGENDALVGNNTDIAVGTGNKMVTQTGLQHNAEKYAADTGINDTYVITLSPVPTSYTNGMVVYFKANTANTGAATLNVNSLGAKTIVKGVSTTLADGDIAAGQLCTVIYDGTNFVLQNPVANAPITNLIPEQIIPQGLSAVPTTTKMTSNSNGSIVISMTNPNASGIATLKRYVKDTFSGQYYITHSVAFNNGVGVTGSWSISILGNYVYLLYSVSTASYCERFDLADLTNATSMTISGTTWGGYAGSSFSDGTYIYEFFYNGSITVMNKYSISGTTMTYVSAITYTSLNDSRSAGGMICDGINVWNLTNSADVLTIQKYPLAGGSVTSTNTYIQYTTGLTSALAGAGFFYSSTVLGLGVTYSTGGTVLKLNAITLP